MAFKVFTPKQVIFGDNAIKESGVYFKDLGKKALIVTDSIMGKIGNLSILRKVLEDADIKYEVYSKVDSEPTDVMVEEGLEIYINTKCDFLIALGGGSPIDAMKAIGAMVTNQGHITEYMGRIIENCPPPLVAIPTTAGTGSEATQFTIILDTKNDIKMLLKGPSLIPALAIIDSQMTKTVPSHVTAATGIDALTHAIEAYTSKLANPLSDTFALSAAERIFKYLRKAYKNGDDLKAREEMALGALEAGIAFNNSSVTIIHGMSRPIGALFHVPHGISNAMLIVKCLKFVVEGGPSYFADIAKKINLYHKGITDTEASKSLVDEVESLCRDINIPTLKEYGINKDEFFANIEKMAEDALASGSPANTRKQPTKEDIVQIYKSLWE